MIHNVGISITWVFAVVIFLLAGSTISAQSPATPASQESNRFTTATLCLPLFAMDPSVRRMTGTTEQKIAVLNNLGYAGLSINDSSLEGLRAITSATESQKTKVHALYLSCALATTGVTLPDHFDEICKILATHQALLWIYVPSKVFKPSAVEGDTVAVPALQAAADRAGRHGVKVALYHHRDNWAESFADAIRVAEQVNRPNFGVSFNLCHSLAAGEEEQIPALLQQAAPRLFMVTINGADSGAAKGAWNRLIQPVGHGTYNLTALLEQLRDIGYSGPFGFQAFGIPGDATATLRSSISAWTELTQGLAGMHTH